MYIQNPLNRMGIWSKPNAKTRSSNPLHWAAAVLSSITCQHEPVFQKYTKRLWILEVSVCQGVGIQ